jgi:hypothetical protein
MKSNRSYVIIGAVAVIVVCVFALSVGLMFRAKAEKQAEKQLSGINELKNIALTEKHQSELREQKASFKSDSALWVLKQQRQEFELLNKNFSNLNSNVMSLKSLYNQNYNELKNIPNEKDHVIDASLSEQSDFISKYKYREYTGITNP